MTTPHPTTFSATTLREGEAMPVITLYAKAGCCLCDQARAYLEDLAADYELELQEIDIRGDPAVFERYRFRIPVIAVDGEERLEGRIEESQVADLLAPRA
ncbi:MAG TPA: glutaredoxin family protein [Ktedonobacterales bacterium]